MKMLRFSEFSFFACICNLVILKEQIAVFSSDGNQGVNVVINSRIG